MDFFFYKVFEKKNYCSALKEFNGENISRNFSLSLQNLEIVLMDSDAGNRGPVFIIQQQKRYGVSE